MKEKLQLHFEKTGDLRVQSGRGRKPTRSGIVEDVDTTIVEQSMDNVSGCSRAYAISRNMSVPYSTVQNILRKNGAFFPIQNSLQSAVVAQRQGEVTDLCINVFG